MARIKANKLETLVQSANEATQPDVNQNDGVFNQPLSKGKELVTVPDGDNIISLRQNIQPTRESWLETAIAVFRKRFLAKADVTLPDNIKVSIGNPLAKLKLDKKAKANLTGKLCEVIGPLDESGNGSSDGSFQIFIGSQLPSPNELLAALETALVRVAVWPQEIAAKRPYTSEAFESLAEKLELEGPFKTGMGRPKIDHALELNSLKVELGPIPYAAIETALVTNGEKTIATRSGKVWCANDKCISLQTNEKLQPFSYQMTPVWQDRILAAMKQDAAIHFPTCPFCGTTLSMKASKFQEEKEAAEATDKALRDKLTARN